MHAQQPFANVAILLADRSSRFLGRRLRSSHAHEAGGAFVYSAAVPRERAQQRSVERMLDTVFRGSAEGLVLTLLQSRGLSKDEAARIQQMIRKAEDRS